MIGAQILERGVLEFRVWAPKAKELSLVIIEEHHEISYPMITNDHETFWITLPNPGQIVDYFYCIDNIKKRPDPASRWQPFGVHGPSRVYDQELFQWKDSDWKGLVLSEYIIYEIHVGTFTPEGTFEAIISRLPHLQQLGITAIELMPISEFPGKRNWGYDGVYPFAPHHSYGSPDDLKHLISACHEAGIAVILDVIYNHFGPEGNYLNEFGFYFTDRYETLWGQAINFDGHGSESVRQYFIDNALYWLTEYHVDSLRLDAIHAIFDSSGQHILKEIEIQVQKRAVELGRQIYIIAESDLNDICILKPSEQGGYGIDAQWNDDFHHALYAYITKDHHRYFADFGTLSDLAVAITDGFVYTGQWSRYRQKKFGTRSKELLGQQFIICLQNHDQIGNSCFGKRLSELLGNEEYRLATMILFCAPYIPLLFMGQEWNASTPFYFFTSFEDEPLAKLVKEGYKREFDLTDDNAIDFDPQSLQRFMDSKLKWNELSETGHLATFSFYKKLIEIRKELKCLSNLDKKKTQVSFDEKNEWLVIFREDQADSQAILIVNFASSSQNIEVTFPAGKWEMKLSSSNTSLAESRFDIYEVKKKLILTKAKTAFLYSNEQLS